MSAPSLWENQSESPIYKNVFTPGGYDTSFKLNWEDAPAKSTQGGSREDSTTSDNDSMCKKGDTVALHATAAPFYPSYTGNTQGVSCVGNAEKLLKLISHNVYSETDNLNALQETQRLIETELQQAQEKRRRDSMKLEELKKRMEVLESLYNQQEELLNKAN